MSLEEENRCAYELCSRTHASDDPEAPLFRCVGCKIAYYCSQSHQRLHWADHRTACLEARAVAAVSASNHVTETPAPTQDAPRNSTAQAPPSSLAPSPEIACDPLTAPPPPASSSSASSSAECAPNPAGEQDVHDAPIVTLIAPGSAGDVFPLLAVGHHLQLRGLRVRVACHAAYRSHVLGAGFQYRVVAGDPLKGRGGQATTGAAADELWSLQLRDYQAAVQGSQLIAFNWFGIAGLHLAEAMGVACVALWLVPFTRTNQFPAFFFYEPRMKATGEVLQQRHGAQWCAATHLLWEKMFWQPFANIFNDWRVKTLGTQPLDEHGHFVSMLRRRIPVLYGWGEAILKAPSDWPKNHVVCGYFDPPQGAPLGIHGKPSEELCKFMEASPAPFYLGLGSTNVNNPEQIVRCCVEALLASRQRLIIVGALAKSLNPKFLDKRAVMTAEHVDHRWLLPRTSCVMHHGGAGTTGAAFKSGVPQIVIPIEYDQFFWAEKAKELGVSPDMVLAPTISVKLIQSAVEFVMQQDVRERAASIRSILEKDDGAATAAEVLKQYLNDFKNATVNK